MLFLFSEVSIILDGTSTGGDVEMDLYYVVSEASWMVTYDVRVSHSNGSVPKRMQVGVVDRLVASFNVA